MSEVCQVDQTRTYTHLSEFHLSIRIIRKRDGLYQKQMLTIIYDLLIISTIDLRRYYSIETSKMKNASICQVSRLIRVSFYDSNRQKNASHNEEQLSFELY